MKSKIQKFLAKILTYNQERERQTTVIREFANTTQRIREWIHIHILMLHTDLILTVLTVSSGLLSSCFVWNSYLLIKKYGKVTSEVRERVVKPGSLPTYGYTHRRTEIFLYPLTIHHQSLVIEQQIKYFFRFLQTKWQHCNLSRFALSEHVCVVFLLPPAA